MTGRTIGGTYSTLVSLIAADDPTTLSATAVLNAGIYGASAPGLSARTIVNAGTILSSTTAALEVQGVAAYVTNSGTIAGTTVAVRLATGRTNRLIV
ncbi:MAG: hypothetical protein WCI94_16495, partial [Rhodospirillales bacterium]